MPKKPPFATRLKAIREACGLNQTDLAKRAGISQNAVWKLESGETENPSWEVICKLAEALGVSTEEFRVKENPQKS